MISRRVVEIDRKITLIQQSTRTLFRVFFPIHDWLRLHSTYYYLWSMYRFSRVVHWTILFLFICSLPFFSNLKIIRGADNTPPILESTPSLDQTFNTNEVQYIFSTTVTDPDGDPVSCSVSGDSEVTSHFTAPDPVAEVYCELMWTPTPDQGGNQAGDHINYNLTLTITGDFDTLTFNIQLHVYYSLNVAPTFSINGSDHRSVKEGELLPLGWTVSDPNPNDTVTVDIIGAPDGATIQDGQFHWRPNYDQASDSDYDLDFTATDGTETVHAHVYVTVTENGNFSTEAGGPEAILILVNQNSPDSIAVGNYYKTRRGVPLSQVLALDITTDNNITEAYYNTQIRDPIRTFLTDHSLKNTIKYIVPTYGIPTKIGGMAVDSYLADLFDEAPVNGSKANNPYWKSTGSNYYITGFHSQPDHFPSGTSIYLVSRLDGTSLKIAKGLVDKALYAGTFTGPVSNNKAYSYGVPYLITNDNKLPSAELICEIMSQAGYNCTPAIGYPQYDITYDPYYDNDSPATQETYEAYFYCIVHPETSRCGGSSAQNLADWNAIKVRMADGRHTLGSQLGGANPLWLVSPGNEYFDIWGSGWRPGSIPFHFQSGTAVHTIRDTNEWWQSVVANLLAADATATTGTVTEPYVDGLPQPLAFFDYFLNGDYGTGFTGTTKHYNYAESMYMASAYLKWTNIVIGDPLYKLADSPSVDTSKPKIENIAHTCTNSTMNISWDNPTALDDSPEVSYGSVDYGTTSNYGTTVWDETALVYLGVSKQNYLSQHSFEIAGIDCSKEYYFKLNAVDPESNTSTSTFILNQVATPTPTVTPPTSTTTDNTSQSSATSTTTTDNTSQSSATSTTTTTDNTSQSSAAGTARENQATVATANGPTNLKIIVIDQSGNNQTLSNGGDNSVVTVGATPITFSGTTTPNSIVEIEIHSDPIKLSTTSDSNGFWSVSLNQLLSAGEHQVFIVVKNQANEIIGQTSYLLKVEVASVAEEAPKTETKKKANYTFLIYLVLVLIMINSVIVVSIRKRHSRQNDEAIPQNPIY